MILAGVLIAVGMIILVLVISGDVKSAKRYRKAKRIRGRITGQREDYTLAAYGGGPAGVKRRRYRQYEVEFDVAGRKHRGIVQTKEKGLKTGDYIEVRYVEEEATHEIVVVSRVFDDRLRELLIGGTLGCVLSAVIIYLKITGAI